MGAACLKNKDYTNAIKYSKQAVELTRQLNLHQLLRNSLLVLVTATEKAGHTTESYQYLKQYVAVNDSLQSRNNSKKVAELEAKYQLQSKEALLLAQQAEIKKKNIVAYFLAGGAIAFLVISLLSYRTYSQKQKLQQQRITELEIQQHLTATQAVLKGEEQERTRLAKDLHDGLGGMLSGIKYSFGTMKGNLILTPENTLAYERSMDMLDSSIKELRMVAHNLMPESLVKFGLDTALKDFCESVTASGVLKVSHHSFGMVNTVIDRNTEISLYRIVQELVNNTIKHAGATESIVQLQKENNLLTITVEDNGKGFDLTNTGVVKGIGLANIQSRVEYLKGKLNVASERGKGTSITIEMII